MALQRNGHYLSPHNNKLTAAMPPSPPRPHLLPCSIAVALALSGCGGDGKASSSTPNQLQSVTYVAENGDVQATVKADYQNGQLVRLRKYIAPGEDNRWDTADDVLGSYISCDITLTGSPLFDAYFESGNDFGNIQNCGLPQLSGKASAIRSIPYTGPGPDSLWFTSDDIPDWKSSLVRNSLGSSLSLESVNVNAMVKPADGLVIIIGQGPDTPIDTPPGIPPLPRQNVYTSTSGGHVSTISRGIPFAGTGSAQNNPEAIINYDDSGHVTRLHLKHSLSANPPALLSYTALENQQMETAANGGTLVSRQLLMPRDYFDNSPYWQGHYPGPLVMVDGVSYAELTDHLHISGKDRPESITALSHAGDDGLWGTADDGAGERIVLTYLP